MGFELRKTITYAGVGIIVAATTIISARNGTAPGGWPVIPICWALSLLSSMLLVWMLVPPPREVSAPAVTSVELLIIGLLLLIAFALRVFNLDLVPFALHNDEMSCGLAARKFLVPDKPSLFVPGWLGHPNLGFFLQSFSMRVFGDNLFGLRMGSVLFGIVSLIAAYGTFRILFGPSTALLALALTLSAPWHIHFSRTGFHNMLACMFIWLSFYSFIRGWKRNNWLWYWLAGTMVGLGVQTYNAAYVTPVVFGSFAVLRIWINRESWVGWTKRIVVTFAGALIPLLPLLVAFVQDPASIPPRAKDVFVFGGWNARHVFSVVGSNEFCDVLWYQLQETLGFLVGKGDRSGQYGFSAPVMDFLSMGLGIIGLIMVLRRYRDEGSQLIACCVGWVLFSGSLLTIDPPFFPRLLVISPALPLLVAISLAGAGRLICSRLGSRRAVQFGMLLVVIFISVRNFRSYFVDYVGSHRGERRDEIIRTAIREGPVEEILNTFPEKEDFLYESYQFMLAGVSGNNADREVSRCGVRIDGQRLKPLLVVAPVECDQSLARVGPSKRGNVWRPKHDRLSFTWAIFEAQVPRGAASPEQGEVQ